MPLRDFIFLAGIIGTLPLCFFRPFYGVLLWTVVSYLNPQALAWGPAAWLPYAVAVAIPTVAGFALFVRGGASRLSARETFLIFALWIWFTITTIISTHSATFIHHAPDTWYHLQQMSKILFMTIITIATIDRFSRLRIFVLVIAGCFGAFVLKALPGIILTGGAFRLYGPDHSMIADNNDFGLALNMTLPLFFFLALAEHNRWVKGLFGFLFVITIPAIFCTYSRGALIGLIVIGGLMFLQLRQRLLLVPVIAFAIIVALVFAPPAWKDRMDPTRPDQVDASAQGRLNAWAFAWHLALDYPVAGGGFGTFTPELFAIYAPKARDIHAPHSVYFQLLAEQGFVGLSMYMVLVVFCFRSTRRLVKLARAYGDRTVMHYANMFRFSLVGFLTSGIFLGRAYFDYFFTIVACIAILKRVSLMDWARDDLDDEAQAEMESGEETSWTDSGVPAWRG